VHEFLAEQEKGTRLVLQVAQAEANLSALNAHVNASSAKFAKTMQDAKASTSWFSCFKLYVRLADGKPNYSQ